MPGGGGEKGMKGEGGKKERTNIGSESIKRFIFGDKKSIFFVEPLETFSN